MKRFEQVPHTADLAARIYATDIKELFKNAASAMVFLMTGIEQSTKEKIIKETIKVEAPDNEALLIVWLNELLYLSFEKNLLFFDFDIINITDGVLEAVASGYRYTEKNSPIKKEIKAATYHNVEIKETGSAYEVTVVFDV